MKVDSLKLLVIIHAALGLIMGYISLLLSGYIGNLFTCIVSLALLIPLRFLSKMIKVESKSWIGNGAIIYVFVWFITWTYFYNVLR
ncbi:MAG: hypothetical protein QXO35_03975 [Candidatus Micrarchaeia archaeon]